MHVDSQHASHILIVLTVWGGYHCPPLLMFWLHCRSNCGCISVNKKTEISGLVTVLLSEHLYAENIDNRKLQLRCVKTNILLFYNVATCDTSRFKEYIFFYILCDQNAIFYVLWHACTVVSFSHFGEILLLFLPSTCHSVAIHVTSGWCSPGPVWHCARGSNASPSSGTGLGGGLCCSPAEMPGPSWTHHLPTHTAQQAQRSENMKYFYKETWELCISDLCEGLVL